MSKTHRSSSLITALLDYVVELVMVVLPHDALSAAVKRTLLRWRGATVGASVKIWRDVWIDDYRKLTIGEHVTIGKSAMFICGGTISLGDNVMVAHGAQLISSGHRIPDDRNEPMRFSGPDCAPIAVEPDAWVGAGAIILPGVTVGRGAVVAAGAVVTKDVKPYTVVGGVPATLIRER